MRVSLITAIVVVAIMASSTALAHDVRIADPNDTPGLLDVRRVFKQGTNRPAFKISTGRKWRPIKIWDRGFFQIAFNTRGDNSHYEYYALAQSRGRTMSAALWRDRRERRDRRVRGLKVFRTSIRSLTVRVPLNLLRIPETRTSYAWYVTSIYLRGGCRRGVCLDRAPDRGAVIDPLVPPPE
jgi:hypothetical protein